MALSVGSKFASYQDLERAVKLFECENFVNLYKKECKKLASIAKEVKNRVFKEELIYGSIVFACVKNGKRRHNSTGERPNQSSFRDGCEFAIKLRSLDGNFLTVTHHGPNHNHECAEQAFRHYPSQRRLDTEQKNKVREMVKLDANKKLIQAHVEEDTNKVVLLKDIHNISRTTSGTQTQHNSELEEFENSTEMAARNQSGQMSVYPSNSPTFIGPWPTSDEHTSMTRSPTFGNYACSPRPVYEVQDLYPGYFEPYPTSHFGVDTISASVVQNYPASSSDMKDAGADSSNREAKDVCLDRNASAHEETGAHNLEGFANETALHCPHPACEKTKRRLLLELNLALSVEKELKARIECLHSFANVNLDLLKRCLDVDKSPEVEGEFEKVYELVRTIMNVQIWDMRARLAPEHITHGSSSVGSFQNQVCTKATKDSNSHVKETTTDACNSRVNDFTSTTSAINTTSSTASSTASDDSNSNTNNLNDYIDDIITKNKGLISEIKNDGIGSNKKGYKPRKPRYFDNKVSSGNKGSNNDVKKSIAHDIKDSGGGKEGMLCDLCGKWIAGRDWHYQIHIRYAHTGERPYDCERCGKKFHNRCTLSNHMSHCRSQERPYQCEECGRAFKCKRNLRKHHLVHQKKDRIYKCPDCNTKCKRLDSFRNHVKSKHHDDVQPLVLESTSSGISSPLEFEQVGT